jgi:hypothetical protein
MGTRLLQLILTLPLLGVQSSSLLADSFFGMEFLGSWSSDCTSTVGTRIEFDYRPEFMVDVSYKGVKCLLIVKTGGDYSGANYSVDSQLTSCDNMDIPLIMLGSYRILDDGRLLIAGADGTSVYRKCHA